MTTTPLHRAAVEPRWWRTFNMSHDASEGGSNIRRYSSASGAANDAARRLRAGDAWCARVMMQARVGHGSYTMRHSVSVSGDQGEYQIEGPGWRSALVDEKGLLPALREALGLAERLLDRST